MTSFGDLAEERRKLLRKTFLKTCDLALSEQVDLFICAGDLFDNAQPDAKDIACAREGFLNLEKAGIQAYGVAGTHDGAGGVHNALETLELPGLILFNGRPPFAPQTLDVNDQNVNIYGLVPQAGVSADLSLLHRRDLPGFHVGILHGSVINNQMAKIPAKDIPVTVDELDECRLDYFALGHYHNFQIIENSRRVLGCYPGTIEAKRFIETGPRNVALVTLTGQGINIDPKEVGQTQVLTQTVQADNLPDIDTVIREISNLGGKNKLARITIAGLLEEILDMDKIFAATENDFMFLELIDKTEVAGNARVRSLAGEPSVRGLAVGRLLSRLDGAESDEEKQTLHLALKLMLHEFERHRKGRTE